MAETSYPLQVLCNQQESLGTYHYQRNNVKDAVLRGIKMTLFALLATALTIAIPLVHFVTVPLGIAVSPLVGLYFFFASKGKPKNIVGEFHCPECQAENHIVTGSIDTHYAGNCHHCGHEFKLVPLPVDPS